MKKRNNEAVHAARRNSHSANSWQSAIFDGRFTDSYGEDKSSENILRHYVSDAVEEYKACGDLDFS